MSDQPTLLASELIAVLRTAVEHRGDLPVFVKDADTNWLLGIEFKSDGDQVDYPDVACFVLDTDYHR